MIEYYNEDCMAGMARYPDKHFDLAIVDPPYGLREHGGKSRSGYAIQRNGSRLFVADGMYRRKAWDERVPDNTYFDELFRVAKNQIIWGSNYMNYSLTGGRVVWDKCNGETDQSDCEIAFCSIHKTVRLFRYMWCGMCQGSSIGKGYIQNRNKKKNEKRIHPTQKPVALYKWLLRNYAKPGDLILDTHVGSASSLIACYDMGFDAVGFELDPDYYKASKQRLEDFMRQPRLDEVRPSAPEQVVME